MREVSLLILSDSGSEFTEPLIDKFALQNERDFSGNVWQSPDLVTRNGVVHARVLADLAEGEEVADGEDDDGAQGHHEEVDDDVRVEVVGALPQLSHLK